MSWLVIKAASAGRHSLIVGGWSKAKQRMAHPLRKAKSQRVSHPEPSRSVKGAPPALTVVGLRLMDPVFGLSLLITEPRTGGGATGGQDYVVVGIENLDC
jgi:hypothetical protein